MCDAFFGEFCFLRQLIKIPIVCSHTSFAMSQAPVPERMLEAGFHPQLDNCYWILNRLSEAYKIKAPSLAQVFISKGDLNIVYTTRHFNGDAAVSEPDYLFASPSVDRQQPASDLDFSAVGKRKLIYISLGSINTDFIDFYNMCISAFRDTEYYVCMSIGSKCEVSQLGEIQANFLIRSFLLQLEILKRADAFITHAGFNSVNEALYYGVPMLALPQVNDQPKVARRIVEMQLGMMADIKELCPQTLKAKTEALMADHKIKENCMRVSQEMRQSAKLDDIAEQLERYTDAWQEVNINGAEK
ncbi:MAG: glycosyltransferase [Oscillospiraceae bacterium]|nr:glycosyltransferase [Oscillospiraceae bacterium]